MASIGAWRALSWDLLIWQRLRGINRPSCSRHNKIRKRVKLRLCAQQHSRGVSKIISPNEMALFSLSISFPLTKIVLFVICDR